jgi:hypothetical protein
MQTEYRGREARTPYAMNATLLRMPRTRKRRISFVKNVRSTIVEARYPARSVIVVTPLDSFSAVLLDSFAMTEVIAPTDIVGMSYRLRYSGPPQILRKY